MFVGKIKLPRLLLVFLALAVAVFGGVTIYRSLAASGTCDQTLSSGANIASTLSSAAAGSTICLNAGSYSYYSGDQLNGRVQKSAMTIVTRAPNTTANQVIISGLNVMDSRNITFDGLTITSATLGMDSDYHYAATDTWYSAAPAKNITISNSVFSGGLCINQYNADPNLGIVIDSSTFNGLSNQACGNEGRISINGRNKSHGTLTWHSGITIKNSTIGNGGCSDGIQIVGEAVGVDIINNNFKGLTQGSCSPVHADPIQFYGAHYTTVEGNIFDNNSTGIMTPDGNGNPSKITNNVFLNNQSDDYSSKIICGGCSGWTINHNAFAAGGSRGWATIRLGKGNTSSFSTNMTIIDNVLPGGFYLSESETIANATSGGGLINYNLSTDSSVRGTNGVNASPTFTSTSPAAHDDYILKAATSGSTNASDSTAIGVYALSSGGGGTSGNAQGDLNSDGIVNIFDLSILLSHFGQTSSTGDLNNDGSVNIFDLSIQLSNFSH